MPSQIRFQVRIEADRNNSSTEERASYRNAMLRRASGRSYTIDDAIEMLTALRLATQHYNRAAIVRIGNINDTYDDERSTQSQSPSTTNGDVPAIIQQQLVAMNAMIERLLLPTELRTLPNASDALAVLNLDTPTTNLNEPA